MCDKLLTESPPPPPFLSFVCLFVRAAVTNVWQVTYLVSTTYPPFFVFFAFVGAAVTNLWHLQSLQPNPHPQLFFCVCVSFFFFFWSELPWQMCDKLRT